MSQLVNIYNNRRTIYLFNREDSGNLKIDIVKNFFPYYYEPCEDGTIKGFNGINLQKVYVSAPHDIPRRRSMNAFEADILFTKRYMVDKVDNIEKSKIKFAFIDIEYLGDEWTDADAPKYPVSCISIYNPYSDKIKTFWLANYKEESIMVKDFIKYMQKEKFDLWLSWNVKFDYNYMANRFDHFAEDISPIHKSRYGGGAVLHPAGISIVDYLTWYKTIFKQRRPYTLDHILELEFGKGKEYKKPDFGKLSEEVRLHNIEDVKGLADIEKKHHLVDHYDEIRRFSKTEWEELGLWNSRIIDMLALEEAKNMKIALPMKPKNDGEKEKNKFGGGFREAYQTGRFYDYGKYDLSGAYMYAIIDLCLDSTNIKPQKGENTIPVSVSDRVTREIVETYNIEQNPNALLPVIASKLITEKNKLKKLKNNTNPETPEYKDIEKKYDALKAIVLSAWGVIGNQYFRLYDKRVASMITSVVRDIIHYTNDKLKTLGYEVIYIDTDGCICADKGKDISPLLNEIVQEWAMERFGKNTSIEFDYEGSFEKLFIIGACHYKGYIRTSKGLKEEIKGIEEKRVDSTEFIKRFQKELLRQILDKESKESIIAWIKSKVKEIKNAPIADISFPCKLSKKASKYISVPIFVRALEYTQDMVPSFTKRIGSVYYWLYMKSFGSEYKQVTKIRYKLEGKRISEKRLTTLYSDAEIGDLETEKKLEIKKEVVDVKAKDKNILAFDEDTNDHIKREDIDWTLMENRNIHNKAKAVFDALHWTYNV